MTRALQWIREWPRPAVLLSVAATAIGLALIGWATFHDAGRTESGLFALGGIVAGGLITALTTWAFARGGEEADLRQATRLVADEVHTQWMPHDLLIEEGRLPKHDLDKLMPTVVWEENKAPLAPHLCSGAFRRRRSNV